MSRRPHQPARTASGFTLIEVLIAVTVFAVLAGAVYFSLNLLADAAFTQRQRSAELADLQRALARLDADLRQMVTRPARSADGALQPALAGSRTGLEATRSGWLNPQQHQRSELQRFGWQSDGQALIRTTWPVTDLAPGTRSVAEEVLAPVAEVEFAYLSATGQWLESWPESEALAGLPQAVRYRLDSGRFGFIERLIVLP